MHILIPTRYFLPGYKAGGALRTIANTINRLADDFEFSVVSLDRDTGDREPYPGVTTGIWRRVGAARVMYLSPSDVLRGSLVGVLRMTPCDVLYCNSLFDPAFTLQPLLAWNSGLAHASVALVAPRGELSPGALALKPLRKQVYLRLGRATKLFERVVWQASTEIEAREIERSSRADATRIVIARDLMDHAWSTHDNRARVRQPEDPLQICFMSRVSPKKNLLYALEVLTQVRHRIEFDVIGPVEDDEYWRRCVALARRLPGNIRFRYCDTIEHSAVASRLQDYDLVFLPTLGENYCHVIVESFLAGTPVLISDQTPWRGLAAAGVGWDYPLEESQSFLTAIDEIQAYSAGDYATLRERVARFGRAIVDDVGAFEANRQLFARALALAERG
jgi:glycosyltransferase involved in cell wall biosynthesis